MKFIAAVTLLLLFEAGAFGQTAKLVGVVYDAAGAVIGGATVTAIDRTTMKELAVKTNGNGEYEIELPIESYEPSSRDFSRRDHKIRKFDLTAEAPYFLKSTVQDFRMVAAYTGKMRIDFALDVIVNDHSMIEGKPEPSSGDCVGDPCGPVGCPDKVSTEAVVPSSRISPRKKIEVPGKPKKDN